MIKVVKKGIILPLILILASVALILGAFFLLDNKPKSTAQNSTQTHLPSPSDETIYTDAVSANWKTYTNKDLGISFRHPAEWGDIKENKDTDCWPKAPQPCLHIFLTFPKVREDNILLGSGNLSYINNVVGKGAYFGHVMGKAFQTGTPFDKFVEEYCITTENERCETKTNQYGVLYTKSLETNYDSLEGLALYYFIYHPNHEFEGITVSNERFLSTPFSLDSEKTFDQILSTFRFVE